MTQKQALVSFTEGNVSNVGHQLTLQSWFELIPSFSVMSQPSSDAPFWLVGWLRTLGLRVGPAGPKTK